MTQKEITKFIFENLEEVSSVDLMQICKLCKEIHEKRTEQCRKDGLFGDYEGFFEVENKNKKGFLKSLLKG